MNKILPAILSCAIVLCFCSCQPEKKNPDTGSATDELLSKGQLSQSENMKIPLQLSRQVESEVVIEEIPPDPVEVEIQLEEVAEPELLKDTVEQSQKVESTDEPKKEKINADKPQAKIPIPLDAFNEHYDRILKKYVDKDGNVDYHMLKRKRRDLLTATQQLANLNDNMRVSFKSKNEEKAFWINAHNILTLKLIIDNYPIKKQWWMINYPPNSIKQIIGGREKALFQVAGFWYTISEIEQDLLNKFKDMNLCFAFSYASVSGPTLRNEVYTAEKLEAQLEDQIAGFFRKSTSFTIDRQKNIVHLSSVFKLYEKGFLNSKYTRIKRYRDKKENLRAYLNFMDSYVSLADMNYLQGEEYEVNYMIFDWTLNEKKR